MASDYDKQQWQAEQAARDAAIEKQREKERKARERSARNAQRKLERLQRTLSDQDEITDFEAEFAESVGERLDKFGSAFHDLEKGRPGDALSFAQKRVVAAMNRKVKDLKRKPEKGDGSSRSSWTSRSGFRTRKGYKPNVRQLDEGFDIEGPGDRNSEPQSRTAEASTRPPVGKPFLKIVK